jgi:hypothetical protein
MFTTPILLITFNRSEHTRRVLTEILKVEPQSLYVCQDGAREGNENDHIKCQEVRDAVKELTSAYKSSHEHFTLHTLYQSKNLGCGPGPVAGITWFFENVEQGIIMEDDCLPHPDFFGYCQELLERYKDDDQVKFINATLYDDSWHCKDSYGFSHYMITGAWASWRSTWQGFDLDLLDLNARVFRKHVMNLTDSRVEANWWYAKVLEIQHDKDKKSYWDYQMQIHLFNTSAVTIHPAVNLINNIGFDEEGTHTWSNDGRGNRPVYGILPLQHPQTISVDVKADREALWSHKGNSSVLKSLMSFLYTTLYYSDGIGHKLLMSYKKMKKS